jgi:hypothetical protein
MSRTTVALFGLVKSKERSPVPGVRYIVVRVIRDPWQCGKILVTVGFGSLGRDQISSGKC